MIETIIQMNESQYPFYQVEDCPNTKVQDLFVTSSKLQLNYQKKRFQSIKNVNHCSLIKLTQIYQQNIILHLIYQYVPLSLSKCIQQITRNQDFKNHQNNKTILKNIAFQLAEFTEFFILRNIKTQIKYKNIGITHFTQFGQWKIKYFLGSNFSIFQGRKQELIEHYMKEKKSILIKLQKQIAMKKKSQYLPNFIIQGNKLIFTDQLSQATQKKPKSQFFSDQKYHNSYEKYNDKNFRTPNQQYCKSKGKWGSKTRQKHHKNSENLQSNVFQQQKLNKSFDQQSQNISVTQTKSMRIQFQQQQNKYKKRKNSYKFRITTFQQISIDQDQPINNFQSSQYYMGGIYKNQNQRQQTKFKKNQQKSQQKKDYRDRVNEAKIKAQNILNKYLKNKKKS